MQDIDVSKQNVVIIVINDCKMVGGEKSYHQIKRNTFGLCRKFVLTVWYEKYKTDVWKIYMAVWKHPQRLPKFEKLMINFHTQIAARNSH